MGRLTVCLVMMAIIAGCSERQPIDATPPVAAAAADASAGKSIAQRSCATCHRDDGSSAAPGIPQLSQQNAAYLVQTIRQYADGARRHAVLKDMAPQLSDADVRNVAAYYASMPAPAPAAPDNLPSAYERGKASAAACAHCHGADGNSTVAGTPSLAGQQPIYLVAALSEYHRGDRDTPGLRAMLERADRIELESLALYYAAQQPAPRATTPDGDPAAGETLALRCSGCHGARGISGDAATPMLAGQDPAYLAKALAGYGKARHHASMQRRLGDISQTEIRDIAAYFAMQKGQASVAAQDLIAPLTEKCDRCHGATAGDSASPVPRIRGQDKDYLVMALRAYRDDRRDSSTMHKMSMPFNEAAIDGLAAYYAGEKAP